MDRQGKKDAALWIARHYAPDRYSAAYGYRSIATADDILDADGVSILTFDQAQREAHKCFAYVTGQTAQSLASFNVADAMDLHFEHKRKDTEASERNIAKAKSRSEAWSRPHSLGLPANKSTGASEPRYQGFPHVLGAAAGIRLPFEHRPT